jgi:hypothetical protein
MILFDAIQDSINYLSHCLSVNIKQLVDATVNQQERAFT